MSAYYSNLSPTEYCYIVPCADGWLIYTCQHKCVAHLRESKGWTLELAEEVRRIIDGEIVS